MQAKRLKMLSVRVSDEEVERIKKLSAEIISQFKYLKEADILRELIGLEDTGIITQEMRARLCSPPPDAEDVALGDVIGYLLAGLKRVPVEQVPQVLSLVASAFGLEVYERPLTKDEQSIRAGGGFRAMNVEIIREKSG